MGEQGMVLGAGGLMVDGFGLGIVGGFIDRFWYRFLG